MSLGISDRNNTKSPVSIRLSYEDLCGSDVLAVTNSQVNRMTKAYQDGKGITIKNVRLFTI